MNHGNDNNNAGITQALRCMCLATFHLGSHNHKMRYVNAFTLRLLGLPIRDFILQHMDLYAHLLHYQVNIDALAGEHGLKESAGGGKFVENTQPVPEACTSAVIIRLLSQLLATFSKKESEDLWKEIATSCHLLPLARDTVSYELLSNLFELSIGRGTPDGAAPAAQLVSSPDGAVVVAGAPAGAQATPAAAAAASAAAAAQPLTPQLEDLDSRMQALELSSPPDPALTTAAPPLPSSAAEGSTDAVAPTPAPAVPAAAAVPAAPAAALDLRLLGSLPALPTGGGLSQNSSPTVNGGQVFEPITSAPLDDVGGATPVKPAMPKHTAEAWANATVSADVPTEFLCGINGHLLRHPVRSPTGEVFEQGVCLSRVVLWCVVSFLLLIAARCAFTSTTPCRNHPGVAAEGGFDEPDHGCSTAGVRTGKGRGPEPEDPGVAYLAECLCKRRWRRSDGYVLVLVVFLSLSFFLPTQQRNTHTHTNMQSYFSLCQST